MSDHPTQGCCVQRVVSLPDAPPPATPLLLTKPVLVIASPDGFVEAYAAPGVRVHIAQRLSVERPEEALADDYLSVTIPAVFREIYRADRLVGCLAVCPLTAEQELRRRTDLELLRSVQAAGSPPLNAIIDRRPGGRRGR